MVPPFFALILDKTAPKSQKINITVVSIIPGISPGFVNQSYFIPLISASPAPRMMALISVLDASKSCTTGAESLSIV